MLELNKYSKQYKNSCRFFACNIITCMSIFSNKLYLILSYLILSYLILYYLIPILWSLWKAWACSAVFAWITDNPDNPWFIITYSSTIADWVVNKLFRNLTGRLTFFNIPWRVQHIPLNLNNDYFNCFICVICCLFSAYS